MKKSRMKNIKGIVSQEEIVNHITLEALHIFTTIKKIQLFPPKMIQILEKIIKKSIKLICQKLIIKTVT